MGTSTSFAGVWVQRPISATSFFVFVNMNKFGIIEAFIMGTKTLGATVAISAGVSDGHSRKNLDETERNAKAVLEQVEMDAGLPATAHRRERSGGRVADQTNFASEAIDNENLKESVAAGGSRAKTGGPCFTENASTVSLLEALACHWRERVGTA